MSDTVPPPEDIPPWATDKKAAAEEKNWDNEDALKGQKARNDLIWLKVYGWVIVFMLIVFVLLFILSLISWSAHYLLPCRLHWLDAEQLSKVQSILFSGSIGSIVSLVAQKQLSK